MTQFTVGYERKLSDGNFGSEGMSMSWTWTNDDDAEQGISAESIELAAAFLRKTVLGHLSRSAAGRVAYEAGRELTPPPPPQRVAAPKAPTESEDLEDLPF